MPENYVVNQTENGSVNISEDVICLMVSAAMAEVEGVAGFSNTFGSDIAEFLGIKSVPKGIKVSSQNGEITVDVLVVVRYGYGIADAARKAQKTVVSSLEAMTGMKVAVNVHVTGISFEKAEIK